MAFLGEGAKYVGKLANTQICPYIRWGSIIYVYKMIPPPFEKALLNDIMKLIVNFIFPTFLRKTVKYFFIVKTKDREYLDDMKNNLKSFGDVIEIFKVNE